MRRKICGIYVIECKINNKKYIGQSMDVIERLNCHRRSLDKNKHKNIFLQSSWNKYKKESFSLYVLYECVSEELNKEEIKTISEFKSSISDFGYNFEEGGSLTNKIVSESTRKKIGLSKIGNKYWVGRHHSETSKIKIGLESKGRIGYWRGKTMPEDIRNKISLSHKGKSPPNKGVPMSEEQKKKISLSNMGNKSWTGLHHSEETKAKLRKPKSEETKRKLKEAWILRKEKMINSAP